MKREVSFNWAIVDGCSISVFEASLESSLNVQSTFRNTDEVIFWIYNR